MPKQYRYREVTSALEAKLGIPFGQGTERSGWFYHDGVKITRITIPHIHRGAIPTGTLISIRKQTLLTQSEFDNLINTDSEEKREKRKE